MKRKNIFTLVISIIMVFTVILSSACNKATTTTTATTTQTTTNTTTQTTTKTTTTTTTTPISDVIKPGVTFTSNANGATDVPTNTKIGVFFTEAMNPLTLNTSTFTLTQGTTPVSGKVVYGGGAAATFTPDVNLAANTNYIATITTGAKDVAGNALANSYIWSWTTNAVPDTTPPTVISTYNANGATDVSINTKVGVFFSEIMDPATLTSSTFTLQQGTTPVAGTVILASYTSTFTPAAALAPNTVYTATITTGATDLAGNAMTNSYVWSWTTGGTADTTAPTVSSTIPDNGVTGMAVNSALAAIFSETMDPLTITTVTFTLAQGTTPVSGSVTYIGMTATFTPAVALTTGASYTATITTGVKDLAGNALVANYSWNFTTYSGGGGGGGTLSSDKAFTAFGFILPAVTGVINETAKTIAVTVPFGTNVTALMAAFTTTGTGVKVGTTVQTSLSTPNNFTSPVAYIVTAGDASKVTYTVTVTVASNSDKAITAYSFAGYTGAVGTINETAKTIAVTVPSGTPLTALVATFITTGTSVKVGTTVQTSLSTPNNFTNPVAYIVTAGDASTVTYTVTVSVTLPQNPTAPVLGETVRFVILASQKVTTTGTTAISNGDIGIIDQARSYYEGFTAGTTPNSFTQLTNGLSYAHDDMPPFTYPAPYASTIAFINQVRTDLGIAYTFLAADPNPGAPTQVCPISLAGLTLTRGVYKTASNVTLAGGNLHLDAQGDPNSVFIISIGGNFTTGSGGNILLENGALAKNVYFRVAGITVIGSASFYGNVFSWQQVNVLAGANITGRLFSVNEQVTLIADTVTKAP